MFTLDQDMTPEITSKRTTIIIVGPWRCFGQDTAKTANGCIHVDAA